jgi:hypothetical protein
MPLITDWTDPLFDSYATLDEVKERVLGFEGIYDIVPWLQTSDSNKENTIRFATRELADVMFQGTQVDTIAGPVAVWPRTDVTAPNGYDVPDDAIPEFVKLWLANRQLEILEFRPALYSSFSGGTVKRELLEGVGETEYFEGTTLRGEQSLSTLPSYNYIDWAVDAPAKSGNVAQLLRF